ncbi:MAG: site-2 protease family protein [Planctomycetaceae bacterium]|nr:site-2 protease family protein [Planctomycetaceae bacterium]
MAIIALDVASLTGTVTNVLTVAIGLGLVIFFHELGHFAVAKWCDVLVERFSIGFGPILWRKKWGETEYALSIIPFGGYVKMLGQDDMDPSQLSSEEIAENPRSYTAKNVLQRMAIISAGVIMNVVTGLLFFMFAFRSGIDTTPAIIGDLQVGMPAWTAGMRSGDRIAEINERDIKDFNDLMRATALTSGNLSISAVRPDGAVYSVSLEPDVSGTRRRIGITPSEGLIVYDGSNFPAIVPASAAAQANPPFETNDEIIAANGEALDSFAELSRRLSQDRGETLTVTVLRRSGDGKDATSQEVDISIPPEPFRTLGLTMDASNLVAVQDHSPAAKADLKVGDRLASVDGLDIGGDIDPLRLPDYFGERHGQEVVVGIKRNAPGGQAETTEVTIIPEDRGGWIEPPVLEDSPIAISSIGVAYHLQPVVLAVADSLAEQSSEQPLEPTDQAESEEGSDADAAESTRGIQRSDELTKLELILPEGAEPDGIKDKAIAIEIGETNLAYAFWQMQQLPNRDVRLTVQTPGSDVTRTIDLETQQAEDWFLPTARGLRLFPISVPRRAETFSQAFMMGWHHTRTSIIDIYLTLRNLVTRQLSVKELHGPLGIVKVASDVADVGIAPFLLFLGFLSINLAVLNFLPIPILDGGHMVFLIWEAVTRRKPSEQVVVAASLFGMTFIVALMALVLYLDISRWYSGTM